VAGGCSSAKQPGGQVAGRRSRRRPAPPDTPPPAPPRSWANNLPADAPAKGEDFYDNPKCIAMYEKFVGDVVTRKNTLTGIVYR
jgi:hypothetical protein